MFHLSYDIGPKDTLVGRKRKQQRTRSYSTLLPHGFHNAEGSQTGSSTDPTVNVEFRYIVSEKYIQVA